MYKAIKSFIYKNYTGTQGENVNIESPKVAKLLTDSGVIQQIDEKKDAINVSKESKNR